ncbi:MAG: barstar family protein, partial [Sterolibacterium sp.]
VEPFIIAAEACGYFVFRVNLATARNKEGLLAAIGRDMAFPEWYGQNWDALADCLTDLGWRPAEGYLLLLDHADRLHVRAGNELATALNVFAEAAGCWREQNVAFWCLVTMQADGSAPLPPLLDC